jgi:coenzyme F420-reducing hydrogenase beta subunit
MTEDEEGFLYPKVDTNLCVDCHLCEKVCPVINQSEPRQPIACYAAKNPDNKVRMTSSSGGIFTMLAEKVINEGGVVFGALFNEKWQVVHSYKDTNDGLVYFRGSKYVQSVIGNTFKETEHFLKEGRKVLFSGTPCQIAGLKKFLQKEYDNLLTVDFICHGVPSPGVFRWYLQEDLNTFAAHVGSKNSVSFPTITSIPKGDVMMPEGISITDIRFRDKREGWKKYSFVLQLAEATAEGKQNTVSLSYTAKNHTFIRGFLKNLYLRPSCYSCPSKSLKSESDITIADFWRIERIHPELDDDKGISTILVNTTQGHEYCSMLSDIAIPCNIEFVKKYNSALDKSPVIPQNRGKFFRSKGSKSFAETIETLCRPTLYDKVKSHVKGLILMLKK